jgi:antitoxin (DNA-binding transcriptional repressor) of toxin-antitoxin stability system
METNVSIEEAQARLREIIARLHPDQEVIITDNEQPVAKLVGGRMQRARRPGPGLCKGMLTIVRNDDEHLQDFREYMP